MSRYFPNLEELLTTLTQEEVASLHPEAVAIDGLPTQWRIAGRGNGEVFSLALPDTRDYRDRTRQTGERMGLDLKTLPDDLFADAISTQLAIGEIRARAGLQLTIASASAYHYFGAFAVELGAKRDGTVKTLTFDAEQVENWKEVVIQAHEFDLATTLPSDMSTVRIRSQLTELGAKWDPERKSWHFHDPYRVKDRDQALRLAEHAVWDLLYPVSTLRETAADKNLPEAVQKYKNWARWGFQLAYAYGIPSEIIGDGTTENWFERFGIVEAEQRLLKARQWFIEKQTIYVDKFTNQQGKEVEVPRGVGPIVDLFRETDEVAGIARAAERGIVQVNRQTIQDRIAARRKADLELVQGQAIPDTRELHDTTQHVVAPNPYAQGKDGKAVQEDIARPTAAAWGPYGEQEAERRNAEALAKTEDEKNLVKERYWLIQRAKEVEETQGHAPAEAMLDVNDGHYVGNLIAYSDNFIAMHLVEHVTEAPDPATGKGGRLNADRGFVIIPVADIAWDDFRAEKKYRAGWASNLDPETQKPILVSLTYTAGIADILRGEHTQKVMREKFGRANDLERRQFVEATQKQQREQGFADTVMGIDHKNGYARGPVIAANDKFLAQRVDGGIVIHELKNTIPKAAEIMRRWVGKEISVGYTDGRMDASRGNKSLDEIRAYYHRQPKEERKPREHKARETSEDVDLQSRETGQVETEYYNDRQTCKRLAAAAIAGELKVPTSKIDEAITNNGVFKGKCIAVTPYHVAQKGLGLMYHTFETANFTDQHAIPKVGEYFQAIVEDGFVQRVEVQSARDLQALNAARALEGKEMLAAEQLLESARNTNDAQRRAQTLERARSAFAKTFGRPFDQEREPSADDVIRGRIVYIDKYYIATDVYANGKYDTSRIVLHPREVREPEMEVVGEGSAANIVEGEKVVQRGIDRQFNETDIGAEISVVYRTVQANRTSAMLTNYTSPRDQTLAPETAIHQDIERWQRTNYEGYAAATKSGGSANGNAGDRDAAGLER